ncbi:calpain-9 [Aplysia californica]|uniref:Calpain-9 n=1 Tax=Aplysia californica TaxID=6500 RepID=A0ABM1A701_APLCA|nr:calpain-9 [Aplysia californica]
MSYSYNSLGRQQEGAGGRLGSSSSQAGTLNRTQVERRPAQFISAKNRSGSTDRLNSSSSSLSGSRSNLSAQKQNATSAGNISVGSSPGRVRGGNPPQQPQHQQPPHQQAVSSPKSPNYSNVPSTNYVNRNGRDLRGSTSSTQSYGPRVEDSSRVVADAKFREFEKVRVDYLRRGKLYEDTMFLPADSSIYFSRQPPYDFEWLRAKDIAALYGYRPEFYSRGISRFDVRQGQLGDCWFVAAMACLSSPEYRNLFERVVYPDQSFQDGWYSGVFRFNFWHFGQWKQILIDDLLPTKRGQLIFVNSPQSNEFWPALMEKAYAKVYGSYEALKGGFLVDSLTDLTGGLAESYTLHGPEADLPGNIVNILFKALERQSIIGCNIINIAGAGEALRPNGLVEGHAYSVTDLRRIMHGQYPVTLIRVRNPHGDHKEWKGRWSEWSQEWQQISPSDREKLGLIKRDDGEFWMDFEDFKDNFDNVVICNLTPDSPVDFERKWHTVEHHGQWTKHFNAGGRPSCPAHWSNPQYFLKLEDTDEDDDNVCSAIIQLMQKDRRKIKQKGEKFLYIGFNVYQYERGYSVPLRREFFETHRAIATSGSYINIRQITKRLTLEPGEYVVVPSTWDADEEAGFYLRFFFEKGNVAEYFDEKPEVPDIPAPTPSPEWKEQEETFKNFFYRVSGEDMVVDAFELKEAIKEGLKKEPLHRDVSIDACKSFVSLMDVDGSGKLSFYEFQFLWHHLRSWKKTFYQFDINQSGFLNSRELRAAINGVGYKMSNRTLGRLIFRYADENGKISLDNFLATMARLMKTYNVYHDIQKDGEATLDLAQWLDNTLVF